MSPQFSTNDPLALLARASSGAAKVFHRHHLEFAHAGEQSLEQACRARGLDPDTVLSEVLAATNDDPDGERWDERPIASLVQHLLDRYHAPLKTELPRLVELARVVERGHAGDPNWPSGLVDVLRDLHEAVERHLAKEEQILFPLFVSGRGQTAYMPVQAMIAEHDDHSETLRRIRDLTRDFELPVGAGAHWDELYRALAKLEGELLDHMHLENNILFPRTLAG